MFKRNLTLAWRSLWKHKTYAAITIFGLSIGLAGLMALFLFIHYHLQFDAYHPNAQRLYRVVNDLHLPDGGVEHDPGASLALAAQLEEGVPQVEAYGLLLRNRSFTVSLKDGEQRYHEEKTAALANPGWFELMAYDAVVGRPIAALAQPNTAVITEALAEKYFGTEDPIGQLLNLDAGVEVEVKAVVKDLPAQTDFRAQLYISFASFKSLYPQIQEPMASEWDWVSSSTVLMARLSEGTSVAQAQENLVATGVKHMGEYMANIYQFRFQPLNEVHFDLRYDGVVDRPTLMTLALVGLLLLVIVSVNFINLATAQGARRAREVGVRKVMGGSRASIFLQYITETAVMSLLGLVLALAWLAQFLPLLNGWLGVSLSLGVLAAPDMAVYLGVVYVTLVMVAGLYPALLTSRMKLLSALKNRLDKAHKASRQRRILIAGQNVIAQVLIVSTLVIAMQLHFLRHSHLGFEKDLIVMVDIPEQDKAKMGYLKDQLLADPSIAGLSFCERAPSSEGGGGTIRYNGGDWLDFAVRSRPADTDYMATFSLQLLAGRNVQPSDTAREVVVNEQMLRSLGLAHAETILGHTLVVGEFSLHPATVVGVVKDFNTSHLYAPIEPLVITTQQERYGQAAVKVAPGSMSRALNHIQEEWGAVYPQHVFDYSFLDERLARAYAVEGVVARLIQTSTVLAIVLSCLGWLGLMSIVTVQRAREIGVRKVLGSSSLGIFVLLSADFLKLVGVAALVATPIAWFAMDKYLQGFAYRIALPWWLFVGSAALSAVIVLATIGYQAIKAARVNPVITLKAAE